jgi:N-acetylmuramoyl-L-alanine amidase
LLLFLLAPLVKNLKYTLLALLAVLCFGFHTKPKVGAIKIIVIDPGHGGKDPGCNGVTHKEKDVSLAVALKLGKLIEENFKDIKVIYTRTTDVFVELEDRAQIANKAKADLFLSIHCNAAGKPVIIKDAKTGKKRVKTYKNKKGKLVVVEKPNPEPFGSETYVMGLKNEEGKMKVATRENSVIFMEEDYEKKYGGFDPESEESYIIMSNYTSAYLIQSANLAVKIQEEYKDKAGRIDRGVHRQSIWVLWRTAMPSILTEIGYLTNPLEETFLGGKEGQDYMAKAIFRGFRKYKDDLEGNKKTYTDEIENQTPLENENVKAGNIPGQKKKELDDELDEEVVISNTVSINNKADSLKMVRDKKRITDSLVAAEKKILELKKDSLKLVKVVQQKFKKDSIEKLTVLMYKHKLDSIAKSKQTVKIDSAKKEIVEKPVKIIDNKIVFKVQFVGSEVELDLTSRKYKDTKNPSYYKMKGLYKYTSGAFEKIKDAIEHQNFLREKGFKDCFVVAFKNGERMDVNEARKMTGE